MAGQTVVPYLTLYGTNHGKPEAVTIAATDVCIDGQNIKSTTVVPVCQDWSDDDGVPYCLSSAKQVVRAPVLQARQFCTSFADDDGIPVCQAFTTQTVDVTKDLVTKEVEYVDAGDGAFFETTLSVSPLTLPNCR
jgi:hypothetical protein